MLFRFESIRFLFISYTDSSVDLSPSKAGTSIEIFEKALSLNGVVLSEVCSVAEQSTRVHLEDSQNFL